MADAPATSTATPPPAPVLPPAATTGHPLLGARLVTSTSPSLRWYRTPIAREDMKAVLTRSNLLASAQTFGYLATLVTTGGLVIWASRSPTWWWAVLPLAILHGVGMSFLINAVHELGHETVFTNRTVNRFWAGFFAFFGYINHRYFAASHARHHRYTLHPPADLEVTLPITQRWSDFWRSAFINTGWARWAVPATWGNAMGRIDGEWSATILPEDAPQERRAVIRWARFLLLGHAAIAITAIALHWWAVLLVVTLAPVFGNGLFWLCNNTQHVGMHDNVADARQCCRTFLLHPIPRFLYWHMNYHVEHHMYAAVPCYRLGRLHRLMAYDLPPCPVGLRATWREIMTIMRHQAQDPNYRHPIALPAPQAQPEQAA